MPRFLVVQLLLFLAFTSTFLHTVAAQRTEYALADTLQANQLLEEMKQLTSERKWEAAEETGKQAKAIYQQLLGDECRQIGNVWHQMGLIYEIQRKHDKSIYFYEKSLNILLKHLGDQHPDVATTYNNLGLSYDSKGEYDKALKYKQKALEIRLHVLGDEHPDVAASYNNLGVSYYNKGEYDKVIELFQKALEIQLKIRGEQHSDVAASYNNLGVSYEFNGEYDKAIEYKYKALEIRLQVFGDQHPDVATSYNNLGLSYKSKGEYDKAIDYSQKALEIRRQALGDKHPDMADSYNNLGLNYDSKGEYDKALEFFHEALEIRLQVLGGQHPDVATSYNNIGLSYDSKGEYDKALEFFQKALEIRLLIFRGQHPMVATSYNNIGVSYKSKGEYDKAIEYYQKTLEILLQVLGGQHFYVSFPYNNLGGCYESKGEYDKAIEYFQKALEIRLQVLGDQHPDVAASYNNLGVSYDSKGEYDKALEYKQKALEIRLQAFGDQHPDIATSYNNLGVSHFFKGEYDKAIGYHQKALEIQLQVFGDQHPDVAASYNNIGGAYESKGEYDKAMECYEKAIQSTNYKISDFQNVNSFEELISALLGATQAATQLCQSSKNDPILEKGIDQIQQAIAAVNYENNRFCSEGSQSNWQNRNHGVYEQAIKTYLLKAKVFSENIPEKVFTFAEKSKASLLQAQLKGANALAFSGIPDSLILKEYNLRIAITWREKQRQSLLDEGKYETDTIVLRIASIIFDLRQQYDLLLRHLEKKHPEYYRAKYDLSVISVEETQKDLLHPNEVLLEYFVSDTTIYAFVIRPDTFAVFSVPNNFNLDTMVAHLRRGLYGYHTIKNKPDTLYGHTIRLYAHAAQELYERLLAPVQPLLSNHIVIVPDGILGYIPFEALLKEKPVIPTRFHEYRYFGKEHVVSYAYSATLLHEMRQKQHLSSPVGTVLSMAPFFRGDIRQLNAAVAPDDALSALRSDSLVALPFSGEEAFRIAKGYKGKSFIGKVASKAAFEQQATNYRIIHLSTHGVTDDRVGDYAWLGFAHPEDSTRLDKLYLRDIYNLRLNADLVVLSACQTGIGKLRRGEGIISLSRAFAYAGAKGIVTTLWSVSDEKTKDFMLSFYRHLEKKYAAEALWEARREFLSRHKGEAAHPYYWAAFIGVGAM